MFIAGAALAKGASGKIASIEGDRVTVQLEKGAAAGFANGSKNIDLRSAEGGSVRGTVVAVKGDRVTLRVTKGSVAGLSVGESVEMAKSGKSGSEEMQGC